MADIKEIKEALNFALTLGKAVDESIQDGFQWTDVFNLITPMTKLPQAIEGLEKVPEELLDMDAGEKKELDELIDSLDLKSDKTEGLVEQALKVATEIGVLVLMIREAKKAKE